MEGDVGPQLSQALQLLLGVQAQANLGHATRPW